MSGAILHLTSTEMGRASLYTEPYMMEPISLNQIVCKLGLKTPQAICLRGTFCKRARSRPLTRQSRESLPAARFLRDDCGGKLNSDSYAHIRPASQNVTILSALHFISASFR